MPRINRCCLRRYCECVLWVIFFVWCYWQTTYLIRLHDAVVWEYETISNTKYFIISSKITTLCSRNRSAVPTYIYIHTQTTSFLLESDNDRHAHIHTTIPTLDLGVRFFLSLPGALPLHTHTNSK